MGVVRPMMFRSIPSDRQIAEIKTCGIAYVTPDFFETQNWSAGDEDLIACYSKSLVLTKSSKHVNKDRFICVQSYSIVKRR